MNDDVNSLRQPLHLIGRRVSAWGREYIIASVAANHNTSGWRVHAIGGMARDMSRPDGADLHLTGRPDDQRLVFWLESDHIGHLGRSTRETRAVLRTALGDLAGLEKCISNVRDVFSAAVGESENRHCIRSCRRCRSLGLPYDLHACV